MNIAIASPVSRDLINGTPPGSSAVRAGTEKYSVGPLHETSQRMRRVACGSRKGVEIGKVRAICLHLEGHANVIAAPVVSRSIQPAVGANDQPAGWICAISVYARKVLEDFVRISAISRACEPEDNSQIACAAGVGCSIKGTIASLNDASPRVGAIVCNHPELP